jgi:hypothetical protein
MEDTNAHARINELSQRVDALVEKMEAFRIEALRLLDEMATAHKPKGAA